MVGPAPLITVGRLAAARTAGRAAGLVCCPRLQHLSSNRLQWLPAALPQPPHVRNHFWKSPLGPAEFMAPFFLALHLSVATAPKQHIWSTALQHKPHQSSSGQGLQGAFRVYSSWFHVYKVPMCAFPRGHGQKPKNTYLISIIKE